VDNLKGYASQREETNRIQEGYNNKCQNIRNCRNERNAFIFRIHFLTTFNNGAMRALLLNPIRYGTLLVDEIGL